MEKLETILREALKEKLILVICERHIDAQIYFERFMNMIQQRLGVGYTIIKHKLEVRIHNSNSRVIFMRNEPANLRGLRSDYTFTL